MGLTGFAGQAVSFLVLLTTYVIIAIGLFCIWSWFFFEVVVRHALNWLKLYDAFIQFIWDHRRYKTRKPTK